MRPASNARAPVQLPFNRSVRWGIGFGLGTVIALLTAPYTWEISPWIFIGIVFLSVIVWHLVETSRSFPPVPHTIAFFCGIQLVLMTWPAYYFPTEFEDYRMGEGGHEDIARYLSYGGPVFLAFVIGMFAPLIRLPLKPSAPELSGYQLTYLLSIFDLFLFGGLGITLLLAFIQIPGLQFFMLLLAYLKFVGVLGFIILGAKGWQWRVAMVLGLEVIISTRLGMFGGLSLWMAAIACYILCFRTLTKTVLITFVVAMLIGLPALEQAKWRIRAITWEKVQRFDDIEPVFGMEITPKGMMMPVYWGLVLTEELLQTVTLDLEPKDWSHLGVRHNHGWIVYRVMQTVPKYEPYAKGKTLAFGLMSALVPRFLAPEKYKAGSADDFEKYTRKMLHTVRGRRTAAMGLGFSGEFYANFGHLGGIIASGIYGLLIGLSYRWIVLKSQFNSLWYAFWPFVFYASMRTETDMGQTINWIIKSLIVLVAVFVALPSLRDTMGLSRAKRFDRKSRTRAPSRT